MDRLVKQIEFLAEIDKLKHIYRQTILLNESRYENDAEHSWHLAVMALFLAEHSNFKLDVTKVVKMVLIHDIVEIDAGDTFCYDEVGYLDKEERELKAADRIFRLLPPDQAEELYLLWQEFEAVETPEAKFAAALDRLQPLIHNYMTKGKSWQKNKVTSHKVFERNKHIEEGSNTLWKYAQDIISESINKGYLSKG